MASLIFLRKKAGLNQSEVAKILNTTTASFSRKETGKTALTVDEAELLFAFYKKHVDISDYYKAFNEFHSQYYDPSELQNMQIVDHAITNRPRWLTNLEPKLSKLDKTGVELLNDWLEDYLQDPVEKMIKETYKRVRGRDIDPVKLKKAAEIIKKDMQIKKEAKEITDYVSDLIELIS